MAILRYQLNKTPVAMHFVFVTADHSAHTAYLITSALYFAYVTYVSP